MAGLPKNADPNLKVGFDTSDDAAIYQLSDEIALVTTVDIITPPVEDPFVYGQIAAANSISDVYAMGGRPVTCLNIVCFPSKKLPAEHLHRIVAGALDKITEAGAVLVGGHSVEDSEPKFGLAVTGVVHPERYWANVGARPGDRLILTKPIGSGVLFNAKLKGRVSEAAFSACLDQVTTLNRSAAECLAQFDIHAATDITGFGLAGHGLEMTGEDEVCLRLELDRVPVMPEAVEMYERGVTTGVNRHNREVIGDRLVFEGSHSDARREIVFDPQTSGGLMVALPAEQAEDAVTKLRAVGLKMAAVMGSVEESDGRVALRIV